MSRVLMISLLVGLIIASTVAPSQALKLISPTQDQTVREYVKITIPVSELPPDFVIAKDEIAPTKGRPFIAVLVGGEGAEKLVAALSPSMGKANDGKVTFLWDSKAPYRDSQNDKEDRFYKDGRYRLTVQLYDADGKIKDSAAVEVTLKNRVARPNPAPGVSLVNRLVFGETHSYKVHAEAQVFHDVSGTAIPILGGLGMTSDFRITQSVEDKQPDGTYLMRCKLDTEAYVSSFGQRVRLYQIGERAPQLYRLVDKFGNVIDHNVFSRQAKYTMMDVLPVLSSKKVKEGDSWPTAFDLKVEGITGVIPLTGTSQLEGFEWQNGHECAKIISKLSGSSTISIDSGRVRSSSNKVDAKVTTYFAYASGKMLRREVVLSFPAVILPGAGEQSTAGVATASNTGASGYGSTDEEDGSAPTPFGGPVRTIPPSGAPSGLYGQPSPGMTSGSTNDAPVKKGTVQLKVVVVLEK